MSPLRNSRGVALMAVLGLALLLGLTMLLVLTLSINRAKSTSHGVERVRALYAAESGYWVALARVLDNAQLAPPGQPYTETLQFPGPPQDLTVTVTVTALDGQGHKRVESVVTYDNL